MVSLPLSSFTIAVRSPNFSGGVPGRSRYDALDAVTWISAVVGREVVLRHVDITVAGNDAAEVHSHRAPVRDISPDEDRRH